jgi:hypothetical protein
MFKQQSLTLKQILDSMPEPAPLPGYVRFAKVIVNETSNAVETVFLPIMAFWLGIGYGIRNAYRKAAEQFDG